MHRPAPAVQHRPGPWWAPARAHALTAATLYRLPVIPLTRSKLPAIPSAHGDDIHSLCTGQCGALGHGVHDASSDPEQVKALFAAAPWAAGYGIACGRPPHHLFGLDLDRKNGTDGVANIHALADRHGFTLPTTATIATQSRGLHLWLTAPTDTTVPNTAGLLARGVDTRGTGGYLVGPGSLGPKGRYTFAPGSGPHVIAPAPKALLRLLTAPQGAQRDSPEAPDRPMTGSPRRRLEALVRVVSEADPDGGERNSRLYWAARTAFTVPGIDPDTAAGDLLIAAVAVGLPEDEARRVLRNAQRGAARDREESGS
ncbi:bifunctional DNA primase/polymerase [Kitasatospora sp. NPDC057936]|uniref:bifunctional DNA primase/polymerase n=1 Tax=Kitasatospora sp. NPDC057936 TaxID=3346283 RepID=UPI0036DBC923